MKINTNTVVGLTYELKVSKEEDDIEAARDLLDDVALWIDLLRELARDHAALVTVEEGCIPGGAGSAVMDDNSRPDWSPWRQLSAEALLAGSVTLSGGHGTGAAWGATFSEQFGLASASELAIASATFGLVLGGLIGGPVARLLIKRVQVPGGQSQDVPPRLPKGFEQPNKERSITPFSFIETLALIAVSLLAGNLLNGWLHGTSFELPTFD